MKKIFTLIVIVAAAAMVSCCGNKKPAAAEAQADAVETTCCGECCEGENKECEGECACCAEAAAETEAPAEEVVAE
ncbi:MAG: hypothetical protein K2J51_02595 [Alistipes sp.]|nr:hypothetical protein [Alistipes sp.]MDE6857917.1 hypothetical protein [Alistipes sp.]